MIDSHNSAEPNTAKRHASEPTPPAHNDDEPGFDYGLVHNHGWACSERGSPAD